MGVRIAVLVAALLAALPLHSPQPARGEQDKKPPQDDSVAIKPRKIFEADGAFGDGVHLADGKTYVCSYAPVQTDPMQLLAVDLDAGRAKPVGAAEPCSALTCLADDRLGAIVADGQVVTFKADGTDRQVLGTLPASCVAAGVARDGKRVAMLVFEGGRHALRTFDGNEQKAVTQNVDETSAPVWSPDGKRLAYLRRASDRAEAWTIGVDGAGERKFAVENGSASNLAWSSDGKRLAYQAGGSGVALADVESGAVVVVKGEGPVGPPAWSPGGDAVVFREVRKEKAGLALASADGKTVKRYRLEPGPSGEYAWSPDGVRVVYRVGRRSAAMVFWTVDIPR